MKKMALKSIVIFTACVFLSVHASDDLEKRDNAESYITKEAAKELRNKLSHIKNDGNVEEQQDDYDEILKEIIHTIQSQGSKEHQQQKNGQQQQQVIFYDKKYFDYLPNEISDSDDVTSEDLSRELVKKPSEYISFEDEQHVDGITDLEKQGSNRKVKRDVTQQNDGKIRSSRQINVQNIPMALFSPSPYVHFYYPAHDPLFSSILNPTAYQTRQRPIQTQYQHQSQYQQQQQPQFQHQSLQYQQQNRQYPQQRQPYPQQQPPYPQQRQPYPQQQQPYPQQQQYDNNQWATQNIPNSRLHRPYNYYLPPVTQPPTTTRTTQPYYNVPGSQDADDQAQDFNNRDGFTEDREDRPVWDVVPISTAKQPQYQNSYDSKTDYNRKTIRPNDVVDVGGEDIEIEYAPQLDDSVTSTTRAPLVIPAKKKNKNKQDLQTTSYRPPVTEKPNIQKIHRSQQAHKREPKKSPPACVLAIVNCCSTQHETVDLPCFESYSCRGFFFEQNPCGFTLKQSAYKEYQSYKH